MSKRKFPIPSWAVDQIDRGHVIEDICEHGLGHPNREFLKKYPEASGIHGCDGCCSKDKEKKL